MTVDWSALAYCVLTLLVIAGSIWLAVAGPCELYTFTRSADVPLRCMP